MSGADRIAPEIKPPFDDPTHLPTYAEVIDRFGENNDGWRELHGVMVRRELFFCEYYTAEYIAGLALHIVESLPEDKPTTVLEAGAGSGRLALFLNSELDDSPITVVPIDSGRTYSVPLTEIDQIDYKEALRKYYPRMVIASWMPSNTDWTADFRKTPNVEEYILIGEAGHQTASGSFETWDTPTVEADGFAMNWLESLHPYQLNFRTTFEAPVDEIASTSRTVSFTRTPNLS